MGREKKLSKLYRNVFHEPLLYTHVKLTHKKKKQLLTKTFSLKSFSTQLQRDMLFFHQNVFCIK